VLRSVIRGALYVVRLCAPSWQADMHLSAVAAAAGTQTLGFGAGAKPLIRERLSAFFAPSWATLHATSIHIPPANSLGKHQLNRNNLHFDCSTQRPAGCSLCAVCALSACCCETLNWTRCIGAGAGTFFPLARLFWVSRAAGSWPICAEVDWRWRH
jgi:hypothetical protein